MGCEPMNYATEIQFLIMATAKDAIKNENKANCRLALGTAQLIVT